MTIEESLSKLEAITAALSDPETTLEQSLELYAQGAKLVKSCQKQLTQAKQKMETITPIKDAIE